MEVPSGCPITFERATGRSTCCSSGEKIKNGEWRVGMELVRAGRMVMKWQVFEVSNFIKKALCFFHL